MLKNSHITLRSIKHDVMWEYNTLPHLRLAHEGEKLPSICFSATLPPFVSLPLLSVTIWSSVPPKYGIVVLHTRPLYEVECWWGRVESPQWECAYWRDLYQYCDYKLYSTCKAWTGSLFDVCGENQCWLATMSPFALHSLHVCDNPNGGVTQISLQTWTFGFSWISLHGKQ